VLQTKDEKGHPDFLSGTRPKAGFVMVWVCFSAPNRAHSHCCDAALKLICLDYKGVTE